MEKIKILMKLRDIIKFPELVEQLGLNPYAINEGADPEGRWEVEVIDIITS